MKKYVHVFFKKLGFEDIGKDGVKTTLKKALYTTVGLYNGPNREEWLESRLKALPIRTRILDAGAGELKYKVHCTHLDYVSQDLGKYDGKGTGEGHHTETWDNSKLDIVCDIIKIPVPDASFGAVLCAEVFEHISEPALAVKEFSRILKKDGTAIISAPFCSLTHFAPFYFANGYSKYWYEKILVEHGFKIEEIYMNGNFFEYLGQEIRNIRLRADRYSHLNKFWWFLFGISQIIMLQTLARLSKNDKGSKELLCFGLLVIAKKI